MYTSRVVLIGLLISSTVILSGCLAAAVGVGAVGGVVYIKGALEAVEAKDIETVYAATKKAASQLGLMVTNDFIDAHSAEISGRDGEDRKTVIKLQSTSAETTKVSIRVGLFGNELRSSYIYQKIHENLQPKSSRP